jgi:hypothetical protein
MKFFNIDCHVSVISDIKNIFEDLGHIVDCWSLSGHKWVLNLPPCKSPIITENNWKYINEEMVEKFFQFHKNDLDKYDAFICAYPPCFLKLFEKFNKPIIVIAATRYDYPFCFDEKRLKWLEDSLNNNKNLILIANNEFDKKYCETFLNQKWQHIPSLCNYTGAKYKKNKDKIVVFSKFNFAMPENFIHQSQLGRYTWEDLYSYKGIMHFPYNVSTMSIFEQYQAGMQLYFPSIDYALELIKNGVSLFSEIVFPNIYPERQTKNFLNKDWLKLSDFYNNTIKCNYFDEKFNLDNTITTSSNKNFVYEKWQNILNKI